MPPTIKGLLRRGSGAAVRLKALGTQAPPSRQALPPRMTSVVDIVSQHMLAIDGVTRVTLDTVQMGPPAMVRVAARGWSPSLHGVNLRMSTRVDLSLGADAVAEQVLIGIAGALNVQRQRSLCASRLMGRVEPLDLGHAVDLEHVHVDASLDALCRTAGYTLRGQLPTVVRRLHEPVTDHDGGPIHATNVGFVAERGHAGHDGASMIREAGLMIPYDGTDERPPFIYDGASLSIHAPAIPETAAVLMAGRPLGDLIHLHPALDGRIVETIEQRDTDRHAITVRLVRALTPFRDLAP